MLFDIGFLLTLILINGALAISEIAVISARPARLVELAESGRTAAKRALTLAREPTKFLSTVQVASLRSASSAALSARPQSLFAHGASCLFWCIDRAGDSQRNRRPTEGLRISAVMCDVNHGHAELLRNCRQFMSEFGAAITVQAR